jgi:hypothetical protein
MVIQSGGSLVEAARMPGIAELKTLKIQMVAEFMAKRTQERSKRSNFFSYGSTHP